ncbi:ATP-binding cassette sub-family A member 12 [Aix galericulata]|nr:ATP-binding cassette sub-family A member 12 [Aix galericulata]
MSPGRKNTQPAPVRLGRPRMAALSQHLRILLWKNWLSVKRQPKWETGTRVSPRSAGCQHRRSPSRWHWSCSETAGGMEGGVIDGSSAFPGQLCTRRFKRRSLSSTAKDNHPSPWSAEVPGSRNASLGRLFTAPCKGLIFKG